MRVGSNPAQEQKQESSWESCYSLTHNKDVDKIWTFWSPGTPGKVKTISNETMNERNIANY